MQLDVLHVLMQMHLALMCTSVMSLCVVMHFHLDVSMHSYRLFSIYAFMNVFVDARTYM